MEDFESATREKSFAYISQCMLSIFSQTISSAFVDRTFSFITVMKNKQRKNLKVATFDLFLRIKSHVSVSDKCCRNFSCSKHAALFTNEMYLRNHNETQSLEGQPGTSEEVFERKN